MDALPGLRILLTFREELGANPLVDWSSMTSLVIRAIDTAGGTGDVETLRLKRIGRDGMQTLSAVAWLPRLMGRMFTQRLDFSPSITTIRRTEQTACLHTSIDHGIADGADRPDPRDALRIVCSILKAASTRVPVFAPV